MADDSKSGEAYGERVRALMLDAIRDELVASAAIHDACLDEQVTERLAWAVAARVDYAFRYRWSPDWVQPGDVHTWSEHGAWRARCGVCLADSPPSASSTEARQWVREHRRVEHDT